MVKNFDKLPQSGSMRESLRVKGQFWTPDWIANAMITYILRGNPKIVFDPAVGPATFLIALKKKAKKFNFEVNYCGRDIDPNIINEGLSSGLIEDDLKAIEIRDFILEPPNTLFDAIIANPPYIRHHRLSAETKASLKKMSEKIIGWPIDGRAGLHVYFILQSLILLKPKGRLAFIVPADTFEGVFAKQLWEWITQHYRLEAVITFAPEASPFQKVDTNPIIIFIKNEEPIENYFWVQCLKPEINSLEEWIQSDFTALTPTDELQIIPAKIKTSLDIGFSRNPNNISSEEYKLSDFARVMRGIATGDNDYFFLTRSQAKKYEIEPEFLFPAIGRTRDVDSEIIDDEILNSLDKKGRPTLLFSPDGRDIKRFPIHTQKYLLKGEEMGIHRKKLVSTRKPWYKMETRIPPPIIFAYLGRRNCRFILNKANVLPLTSFLAIYPKENIPPEKLFRILNHPKVIQNLFLVGKSYGDGAVKVEPRALENLPIPKDFVKSLLVKENQL